MTGAEFEESVNRMTEKMTPEAALEIRHLLWLEMNVLERRRKFQVIEGGKKREK